MEIGGEAEYPGADIGGLVNVVRDRKFSSGCLSFLSETGSKAIL